MSRAAHGTCSAMHGRARPRCPIAAFACWTGMVMCLAGTIVCTTWGRFSAFLFRFGTILCSDLVQFYVLI